MAGRAHLHCWSNTDWWWGTQVLVCRWAWRCGTHLFVQPDRLRDSPLLRSQHDGPGGPAHSALPRRLLHHGWHRCGHLPGALPRSGADGTAGRAAYLHDHNGTGIAATVGSAKLWVTAYALVMFYFYFREKRSVFPPPLYSANLSPIPNLKNISETFLLNHNRVHLQIGGESFRRHRFDYDYQCIFKKCLLFTTTHENNILTFLFRFTFKAVYFT